MNLLKTLLLLMSTIRVMLLFRSWGKDTRLYLEPSKGNVETTFLLLVCFLEFCDGLFL